MVPTTSVPARLLFWAQLKRRGAVSEALWDPIVRHCFSSCISSAVALLYAVRWRGCEPAAGSGVLSPKLIPGHQNCSRDFGNLSEL